MEVIVFIFLVILGVIIIVVILRYILKLRNKDDINLRPSQVGEVCDTTSDCEVGLTCDQSICLIPIAGSCVNREDMCSQNGNCNKGMCMSNDRDAIFDGVGIISKGGDPVTKNSLTLTKNNVSPNRLDPYCFHSLSTNDGRVNIKNKNIVDASYGISVNKDNNNKNKNSTSYLWYVTLDKGKNNKYTINAIDNENTSYALAITDKHKVISCQAFGKICYVLIREKKDKYSIIKYTLLNKTIKVEFPMLPKHEDVDKCINLGVSDKGVIMIVTENSNISFNIDAIHEEVSSWYLLPKDNRNILHMSYVDGKLLSFNKKEWFYGGESGTREEGTYPDIINDEIVNKKYWSKMGIRLSL